MDKTEIVVLPRDQWTMNKKYPETFWRKQFTMDPEKELHKSTDLYKVWHEKKEFVKRAIALNPFEHDDFIWMDAGCIRSENMASLLLNFPHASRIPTNRMLLLNIQPFSKQDNTVYRFEKGLSAPQMCFISSCFYVLTLAHTCVHAGCGPEIVLVGVGFDTRKPNHSPFSVQEACLLLFSPRQ